jgi:hypothetical protein
MVDVRVEGAEQLAELAALLKRLDDRELRKRMLAGLREAGKPLARAAEDAARANLPRGGGLNEWVAGSKFAIRTKTTGKSAGIRVVATKRGHDLVGMNAGVVRHPVFGIWRPATPPTRIRPGWWQDAIEGHADQTREALGEVLDDISAKIDRSI